jgi:diacylglycerol O-acyltransferase
MDKLGGLDAMFLYNETRTTPMHVGTVLYLEAEEAQRSQFYEDFRAMLLERIHLVPYLTNRVETTPFGIDHPVWVRDRAFDIDRHLHRLQLPAPGDVATLERVVAELYEAPMDRSKPLWEMWVIEGLDGGGAQGPNVAIFQKTHHAAIDGVSSVKAAELMYDVSPTPRAVEPAPADFWKGEPPSYAALLDGAFRNLTRYWMDGARRVPVMLRSSGQLIRDLMAGARRPMPMRAPKTRFNASIDAQRSFAAFSMSVSALKDAGRVRGAKLNDVVLAICGEGLARYLARHGETQGRPLIASCPVSLHQPGDTVIRNQVSSINVSMCNEVEDYGARIAAIKASADNAKATLGTLREAMPTDFGAPGLPAIFEQAARAGANGALVDLAPEVPMNVVVSNVPGFRVPMYVAGARLIGQMPMSIVVHGGAVNLTVASYVDRLDLGITAATRRVPDIEALREDLEAAYDDIVSALLVDAAPSVRQAA